MKAYKNIGFGPRKGKKGFTLIELLIVMVILAILAGVIVMAVGGVFGSAKSAAYSGVESQVGTAVGAYAAQNSGTYPTGAAWGGGNITDVNDDTVLGTSLSYIAFGLLLTGSDGMLSTIPDGVADVDGAENDNCDQTGTGESASGCDDTWHYVWLVDTNGVCYSVCINGSTGGCAAALEDGYQEVWP